MGKGGPRPGAGRKPNSEKYGLSIAAAGQQLADKLPFLIDNMIRLADGGFEVVEEEWGPSKCAGDPHVLLRRKVSVALPDRAANQYLIDRAMGKLRDQHEVIGGSNGAPFKVYIGIEVDRV